MAAIIEPAQLPVPQFAMRGKDGVSFGSGPVEKLSDSGPDPNMPADIPAGIKSVRYSRDGRLVALLSDAQGVRILCTFSGQLVCSIPVAKIQNVELSPCGTYAQTWERPQDRAVGEGNHLIYEIATGTVVGQYHEKRMTAERWPFMQWTEDESFAARMVTNEVHVFDGRDLPAGIVHKVRLQGGTSFAIAPKASVDGIQRFALFKKEQKGKPAQVQIFGYPGESDQALAAKSMFKAQDVELKWSPDAKAVLARTETAVDTTGKSYYGETGLFLIHGDGSHDCNVIMTKEGNVVDVQWSPTGRQFVVIGGRMPANSTLFNLKGDPVFEFGAAHRNTIRWSPHGRFLCLGGFGNLQGDMDFWDINKKKKMGSQQASCSVVHEWSPCGRYFLNATTFPRMRVDNGYVLRNYRGDVVTPLTRSTELYDIRWRPAPAGLYPDLPAAKLSKDEREAVKEMQRDVAPKRVAAYRPPGARAGRSSIADMMKADTRGGASTGKVGGKAGSYKPPGAARGIPGMTAAVGADVGLSKNQLRNARKKKAKEAAAAAAAEPLPPPAAAAAPVPPEKQLRKANKALKAVAKLKADRDGGKELNAPQLAKVATEAELLALVEKLTLEIARA